MARTSEQTQKTRQGLNSYLRGLAKRRKNNSVTADDAHRYLDRQGVTASYERLGHINSVLNNQNTRISASGTVISERPVAKGRAITRWTWRF